MTPIAEVSPSWRSPHAPHTPPATQALPDTPAVASTSAVLPGLAVTANTYQPAGIGSTPAPLTAQVHGLSTSRSSRRRKKRKPSIRSQIWITVSKHLCKATCAFFDAVQAGKVEEVQHMVENSPKLLLRTKPGTSWTAAHLAAEQGDFQMTMVLFDVAERIDRANNDVHNNLVSCIPQGPTTSRSARHMLSATTEKNLTALMLACKRGHPATASFLMSKGSSPLTSDREGAKMAIHYASLYGHWSCVQVLLDRRWTVRTANGEEPLATAVVHDAHGQRKYIDVRTCAGLTPLHMAAWAGHTEVAKILLQHGALMSPRTVHSSPTTSSVLPGSTPIHLAARKNRIQVVKVILLAFLERQREQQEAGVAEADREVDPRTICDEHGNYAVMHAITRGNNNMAALLDADASLEVLLVNDGGQLGQLPKLSTLAMGALRLKLLRKLDEVVRALPRVALKDEDHLSDSDIVSPTSKNVSHLLHEASGRMADLRLCDSSATPDLELQLPLACNDSMHDGCLSQRSQVLATRKDLARMRANSFASCLDADSVCSQEDEGLCSICMENSALIKLTRCQHTMCAPCARKLLLVGTSSACQCPFCRMYISAFEARSRNDTKMV